MTEVDAGAPDANMPVINPGPPKKPRFWFQFRLWMPLLAMTFLSLIFSMYRPEPQYSGPIAECHIQVRNIDDEPPRRSYFVKFLDGTRERYVTAWFQDQEILLSVEVREFGATRIYVRDGRIPPQRWIEESTVKVFEQVRDLARARAEDPRTLDPPIYDAAKGRVTFDGRAAQQTIAYLHSDAPHAESGMQPAAAATSTAIATGTAIPPATATATAAP